jgi:hypothetical protein
MPFNKLFFDEIHNHIRKYIEAYLCDSLILVITAYGKEYNVGACQQL